tara:strand:- start:304 stop:804 length:501 start_codon:yes stop_codon:yes gene_type:complete
MLDGINHNTMSKENPKLKKNGGEGTFVGNALRVLAEAGKIVAPTIIDLAANAVGLGDLINVREAIKGDPGITGETEAVLLREIDKDISLEQEITKRWESDNKSELWLPRMIRPMVVANFTILIDIVVVGSMWGKSLAEAFIPLLITMGTTVIGGYFALREYGKTKS